MKKLFMLLFTFVICCSWSFAQPSIGSLQQEDQMQAGQVSPLDQTPVERRHKHRKKKRHGTRTAQAALGHSQSAGARTV